MNRQQRRAAAKSVRADDGGDIGRLRALAQSALAQGNAREASLLLKKLLKLTPFEGAAWRALAKILMDGGQLAEALATLAKAKTFIGDDAGLLTDLGLAQQWSGRLDDAAATFRRVVALAPAFPNANANLAGVLKEQGRLDESLAVMRETVARHPQDARATFNLALLLLSLGRYEEGWDAYEARMRIPEVDVHSGFPQPQWDGGDISEKVLLVHAEQGLGDVIQFSRYLPMLGGRAKRLLFAVPPPLKALFQGLCGVDTLLTGEGPAPSFDCHCPLLSLPRLLKTRQETIPAAVPYLACDDLRVAGMAERFAFLRDGGLKIGLVWAGDARAHDRQAHRMDQQRSLPLAAFAPLGAVSTARFVSLQKGRAAVQVQAPPTGLTVFDPMPEIDDFADTAAIIAHLDLVITVDTAVAHLAGAMGKPVWILSRFDACWRWLRGHDDSPWYPTAHLFRQSAPGEWGDVMRRVAQALAGF